MWQMIIISMYGLVIDNNRECYQTTCSIVIMSKFLVNKRTYDTFCRCRWFPEDIDW